MNGRRALAGILFVFALVGGYVAALAREADEGSQWMFAVGTAFFALLAIVSFLSGNKRPPPPAASPATRFVPHWIVMTAVLVVVVSLLAAVMGAFRRH